jgi:hypothetical protein
MVLGVQWLKSLGLILWDFDKHTLAFVHHDHLMLWSATNQSSTPPSLMTTEVDPMGKLLLKFAALYVEPTCLPSTRGCDHIIRLLLETALVRPYRYAYPQKEVLEIIRMSMSALLLVKKSHGSWHLRL